jgi:hypothetical protein
MLKAYRFTLQMPACVKTCATFRVEPEVNGSSSPSVPTQNRSVIAVGKMRSPSPVATRSQPRARSSSASDDPGRH